MDTTGKHIRVGTTSGQVENSKAMATLPIPQVKADFPTKGYIMPTFTNTLIGVGPICDADCTVVFKKRRCYSTINKRVAYSPRVERR